ncbi:MAG: hypothetical protein R2724_33895 [Bryobacterales bacterium]
MRSLDLSHTLVEGPGLKDLQPLGSLRQFAEREDRRRRSPRSSICPRCARSLAYTDITDSAGFTLGKMSGLTARLPAPTPATSPWPASANSALSNSWA